MHGRFRADRYEKYMAVSMKWGSFCGCPCNQSPTMRGILVIRALVMWGICIYICIHIHIFIRAPDFWKFADELRPRFLVA